MTLLRLLPILQLLGLQLLRLELLLSAALLAGNKLCLSNRTDCVSQCFKCKGLVRISLLSPGAVRLALVILRVCCLDTCDRRRIRGLIRCIRIRGNLVLLGTDGIRPSISIERIAGVRFSTRLTVLAVHAFLPLSHHILPPPSGSFLCFPLL